MMLPRLSGGVSRFGSAGRARGGVLPAGNTCYAHCNYKCNDNSSGCIDGDSDNGCTNAQSNAKDNAVAYCNNGHGGYQSGTTGDQDCASRW